MIFRVCSVGGHQFGEIPKIAGGRKFDEDEYVASLQRDDVEMDEFDKVEEIFDERLVDILKGQSVSGGPSKPLDPDGEDEIVIEEGNEDLRRDAHNLFLSLAICNTVVPSILNDEIVYQSSSPDETALVLGAKKGGYVLKSRSVDECTITIFEQPFTYETLAVNEFTSDRRRMSVLVRMPDGSVRLYIKGICFAKNARRCANDEGKGVV
jgi:magnesium-transporting ATPase (P-type)